MNLVQGYSAGKAGCCTATWNTLRKAAGTGRGVMPGGRSLQRAARAELARDGTRLRKTYVLANDDSLDGIAAKRRRKVLRVLSEAEVRAERRCAKLARRRLREAQSRDERARARAREPERKPSHPSVVANVIAELASRPLRLVVDNTKRPTAAPPATVRPPPAPPPSERPATRDEIEAAMDQIRRMLEKPPES